MRFACVPSVLWGKFKAKGVLPLRSYYEHLRSYCAQPCDILGAQFCVLLLRSVVLVLRSQRSWRTNERIGSTVRSCALKLRSFRAQLERSGSRSAKRI